MLVVGYLAVFMIGFANGRAPLRHFNNELLNLPVRWDAGWYLQIVTDGYRYAPGDPTVQQNIVFFPAYPMLMRVAGRLLGGDMTGYVAAGMIVSLASFFGALAYLYAFARDRFGDDGRGGRSGCWPRTRSRSSSARCTPSRCSCWEPSARSTISPSSSSDAPRAGDCSSA